MCGVGIYIQENLPMASELSFELPDDSFKCFRLSLLDFVQLSLFSLLLSLFSRIHYTKFLTVQNWLSPNIHLRTFLCSNITDVTGRQIFNIFDAQSLTLQYLLIKFFTCLLHRNLLFTRHLCYQHTNLDAFRDFLLGVPSIDILNLLIEKCATEVSQPALTRLCLLGISSLLYGSQSTGITFFQSSHHNRREFVSAQIIVNVSLKGFFLLIGGGTIQTLTTLALVTIGGSVIGVLNKIKYVIPPLFTQLKVLISYGL